MPPVRPGEIADDSVRRPVCGIPGLGYLPACQQLIADESAQLPRRIAASLRVVHIVAERPPAVRFPVIAWVLWVQRVIAKLSAVELSHLYVRQYVPGIGQVSRGRGKGDVPGRPSRLIRTLRLISTMVRVPQTGAMLCRPGGAITISTCGGVGTAILIAWRHGMLLVTGGVLNPNTLAVCKYEGGPVFRILHDCTVGPTTGTSVPSRSLRPRICPNVYVFLRVPAVQFAHGYPSGSASLSSTSSTDVIRSWFKSSEVPTRVRAGVHNGETRRLYRAVLVPWLEARRADSQRQALTACGCSKKSSGT